MEDLYQWHRRQARYTLGALLPSVLVQWMVLSLVLAAPVLLGGWG